MRSYRSRAQNIARKEAIFARFPSLISFIEQDLGYPPESYHGAHAMFNCWGHEDSTASLSVDDGKSEHGLFHCKSAGCNHGGDLIDWVAWRHNLNPRTDFFRILDLLDNGAFEGGTPVKYQPRPKSKRAANSIPNWKVLRDHRNFDKAMGYFGARGISDGVGRQFYLGARIPFSLPYQFIDGSEVWLKHNRYAIPNVRGDLRNGGKTVAVALRYDDHEIRETFKMLIEQQPDLVSSILRDLKTRAKINHDQKGTPMPNINVDYCIKRFYRAKYHNLGDISKLYVYNADYLVKPGTRERIARPLVFAVEGQIDCASLISAGYPTVAIPHKDTLSLAWLFELVDHVVIIADNDGGKGLAHAEWVREMIARPNDTRIILPINGKDANDEVVGGTVHSWMSRYGYEPLLVA